MKLCEQNLGKRLGLRVKRDLDDLLTNRLDLALCKQRTVTGDLGKDD